MVSLSAFGARSRIECNWTFSSFWILILYFLDIVVTLRYILVCGEQSCDCLQRTPYYMLGWLPFRYACLEAKLFSGASSLCLDPSFLASWHPLAISTNNRMAIIGGGPGGLTLARILQKHGIRVTIYEREPSPNARSQEGGSLDLHHDSGLQALKEADLFEDFLKTRTNRCVCWIRLE